MTHGKTISNMRLVGGHPGLDFVNTVDARRDRWGPDLLTCYADLTVLADRVALMDHEQTSRLRSLAALDPSKAMHVLERAKALREAIHGVLLSEAVDREPEKRDVELVRVAVQRALSRRTITPTRSGFAWSWNDDGDLDSVANRLAYSVAELLVTREVRRPVRECPGRNCGWLFLDNSRGGRRLWCSDEACGSHDRVRRFRAKSQGPSS